MFAGAALQAVIAAVIFAVGAGAGWAVNGWRNGAEIQRLQANDAVVTAANKKCEADVSSVKAGVKEITDAATERTKAAEAAMASAQKDAAVHLDRIRRIHNALPVAPENQCAAIIQEQIDYVAKRKAGE